MQVECGQRLAAREHTVDAIEIRKQHLERCLHLEFDPGTEIGHAGRVAAELERVAEPLLSIE